MAFDANDLSPHEHFVVERTRSGEVADFSPMAAPGEEKPVVRAGFLRKLMLQLDPAWIVRTPGVRLKHARIEGALDLTNCSGAGGAGLPALALTECDIPEPIDLSHARLARVSLKGARLSRLLANEAKIDGELDLCGIAPLGAPGLETLTANLRGARIDGDLTASGAKFARLTDSDELALSLQYAEVKGNVFLDRGFEAFGCVDLFGAVINGMLDCEGGQFLNRLQDGKGRAIMAESAHVRGAVVFSRGFRAEGEVQLIGMRIGASLECDGGKFLNRTADGLGAALIGENVDVGGDVFLRDGFAAEGEVWFEGAHIRGDIDIEGGTIRNEGGEALMLCDTDIGGAITGRVREGNFKAVGRVSLEGARIGRNLNLRGAEISNPRKKNGSPRRGDYDTAVDAASVSVGGAALFHGANIKGELFLADARIQGYLAFGGGRYINGGHWAIRAPNLRVGGNLTFKLADSGYAPLGQKTVIEGGAKFDRAQIDSALAWAALELRGPGPDGAKGALFSFADARIGGPLQAQNLVTQQDAHIDASGASCAALDDDLKTGWGMDGARLDLHGFAYRRFEAKEERWRQRLHWLKRSRRDGERFSPQPFAQAAQVYARAGLREDARRILLAQHDMRTLRASSGPMTWALSSAFGLVAGYGLAPIRIARALVLFIALGVAGALIMNAQGALVRADGKACNGAVEPALYAIDVALPVIDLGQESRCAPGRTARAELSPGIEIANTDWRLFEGGALWRWAHALYALLGAVLTALAVITFSGVMKPKGD